MRCICEGLFLRMYNVRCVCEGGYEGVLRVRMSVLRFRGCVCLRIEVFVRVHVCEVHS